MSQTQPPNPPIISPDGRYQWDGQAWQPIISPDGRYQWDGQAWQPISPNIAVPRSPTASRDRGANSNIPRVFDSPGVTMYEGQRKMYFGCRCTIAEDRLVLETFRGGVHILMFRDIRSVAPETGLLASGIE